MLDRRPDVPPALERVLFRALERAREARYETIEEFSTALAEAARAPVRAASNDTATASPAIPTTVPDAVAGHRWRSMALVIVALLLLVGGVFAAWRVVASRAATAAAAAGPRVVAVLPFKNLGAPGDQYFADGLTEEITSRLAGLSGLRVISRTSADQYRDEQPSRCGRSGRSWGRTTCWRGVCGGRGTGRGRGGCG